MISISVVVPSYNQPRTIEHCIGAILNQDVAEKYELIVVDSSIKKKQEEIESICRRDERIKLIKLQQQTYPGIARNIGIKKAKGKIIALIDSDCVVDKSWLKNILKHIQDDIILTGIIKNGTKKSIVGTSAFLVEFNALISTNQIKRNTSVSPTGCFACYKYIFEKIGYFADDRAFEDVLFFQKFKKNIGNRIYQIRDIVITHMNRTRLKNVVKNQRLLGHFSAKARKKNNMPPELVFSFPVLAFGLIPFRYFAILTRICRSKYVFSYILLSPIILYLLFQWSLGFYLGSKNSKLTPT